MSTFMIHKQLICFLLTMGPRPNSSGNSANLRVILDLNSSCEVVLMLSKTSNKSTTH